jgi:hypothetical protein
MAHGDVTDPLAIKPCQNVAEILFHTNKRTFSAPVPTEHVASSLSGRKSKYSIMDIKTGIEYTTGSTLQPGTYIYKQPTFYTIAMHECLVM